jgi:glycine cleavage system aminomethyltransferase T
LAEKARNKERGGMTRRMANVLVPLTETDPLLYHGEVIWRNGNERISDIRSASYGHTVKGGVGLTMLDSRATGGQLINKEYIDTASWEVEIAKERYPCQISLSSFYDPKNTRIKL